jgi:hypothetical protein
MRSPDVGMFFRNNSRFYTLKHRSFLIYDNFFRNFHIFLHFFEKFGFFLKEVYYSAIKSRFSRGDRKF